MDKSWIEESRFSDAYLEGVDRFLDFAFSNKASGGVILCPCTKCGCRYYYNRNIVYDHLICDGFEKSYTSWYSHGEMIQLPTYDCENHAHGVRSNEATKAAIENLRQGLEQRQSIGQKIKFMEAELAEMSSMGSRESVKPKLEIMKAALAEMWSSLSSMGIQPVPSASRGPETPLDQQIIQSSSSHPIPSCEILERHDKEGENSS